MDESRNASLPLTEKAIDEESVSNLVRVRKLTELLLLGAKSKNHTWIMNLNEALRAAVTTPSNITFSYKPGARGNHSASNTSLHQLLTLLRDALLHMR